MRIALVVPGGVDRSGEYRVIPALLALIGFVFVLVQRPHALKEIRYAVVLLVAGLIIYFVRSAIRQQVLLESLGTRSSVQRISTPLPFVTRIRRRSCNSIVW